MNEVIAIFVGGGLGSLARYGTGKWIAGMSLLTFPFGTLAANLISSLILGLFLGFSLNKPESFGTARFLIAVGFCGGYSTFSTFSVETFDLFKHGLFLQFFLNISANLIGCLAAVAAGIWIGKTVHG